jgi:LysR family transcriptional repressor of citA
MDRGGGPVDIKLLRTFVTAARLNSLTLAAERLFLAQPTVTVQIARLEEQLGYPLFKRSHTGVTLTPAGHRFLPHATRILETYDAGVEDLVSWSQGYKHRLTVLSSPLIAATALPPLLRQFTTAHPDVELTVTIRDSVAIGGALAAGAGDVGLSLVLPAERALVAEQLYGDAVMLVAPPDGRGPDSGPADWQEILERYLLFTHNHPVYWDDLLLALRQTGVRLRSMRVSQTHVTKRMVEEGLGVSFLPESVVARELAEGRLVTVPAPRLTLPRAHTYLIHGGDAGASPPAADFVALLRRTFGTGP